MFNSLTLRYSAATVHWVFRIIRLQKVLCFDASLRDPLQRRCYHGNSNTSISATFTTKNRLNANVFISSVWIKWHNSSSDDDAGSVSHRVCFTHCEEQREQREQRELSWSGSFTYSKKQRCWCNQILISKLWHDKKKNICSCFIRLFHSEKSTASLQKLHKNTQMNC